MMEGTYKVTAVNEKQASPAVNFNCFWEHVCAMTNENKDCNLPVFAVFDYSTHFTLQLDVCVFA